MSVAPTLERENYVTVNGVRVRYVEWGEGPPLVLVHGLSVFETADTWRRSAAELGAHFHCYSVDLPGWGLSDMPSSGYSFRMWVDAVAGVVEQLDLKSVDLMGYSFGAWIAGLYASENPGRVRRFASLHNPGLNKVISQYHPVDDVPLPDVAFLTEQVGDEALAKKIHADVHREGRVEAHVAALHVIRDPEVRETWSLRSRAPDMTLPILAADNDIGFVTGTVDLARLAPCARLTILPPFRSHSDLVSAGLEFLLQPEIKPIRGGLR